MAGLFLQWQKSRRDELRITCDEFCAVVQEAANLASEYWLTAGQIPQQEARLVALQRRLDGYRVLVSAGLSEEGHQKIISASSDLFDAMTGGAFSARSRGPDQTRSAAAQYHASDLILAIRTAFHEAVTFKSTFGRMCRRLCNFRGACRPSQERPKVASPEQTSPVASGGRKQARKRQSSKSEKQPTQNRRAPNR